MKNTVTVSQEKVLQETTERLQREQRELQDTQHRLRCKEDEVKQKTINNQYFELFRGKSFYQIISNELSLTNITEWNIKTAAESKCFE